MGITGVSNTVLDFYTAGNGTVNRFDIGNKRSVINSTTVSNVSFAVKGNGSDALIDFVSSTGASQFYIGSNGNIGINSSTPIAKLSINSSNGTDPVLEVASSTGGSLLRVLANGNVGIGTTTPSEKLQVVGNISNIIRASTTISQIATVSVGTNPYSVFVFSQLKL